MVIVLLSDFVNASIKKSLGEAKLVLIKHLPFSSLSCVNHFIATGLKIDTRLTGDI